MSDQLIYCTVCSRYKSMLEFRPSQIRNNNRGHCRECSRLSINKSRKKHWDTTKRWIDKHRNHNLEAHKAIQKRARERWKENDTDLYHKLKINATIKGGISLKVITPKMIEIHRKITKLKNYAKQQESSTVHSANT